MYSYYILIFIKHNTKMEKLQLFNWNTQEILKDNIKDETVDCIISDPPYNIDYNNNRRKKTRNNVHWIDGILNDKDNLVMISDIYKEYFRVLKEWKHIYIFSRWDVTQEHIESLKSAWFVVKNVLIWVKNSWSMWDLYWNYASQYETIIFWVKLNKKKQHDKLNIIDWKTRHSNVLSYPRVAWNKQVHSHQKPEELLEFLMNKSTKENETVLDWFLGSWSCWIASLRLNRKFIGIELSKDIFETAKERINKSILALRN